jgi:hypothetical protein
MAQVRTLPIFSNVPSLPPLRRRGAASPRAVTSGAVGRARSPFEVDYLGFYGVLAAARPVKVSSKSIHSSVDNPVEN